MKKVLQQNKTNDHFSAKNKQIKVFLSPILQNLNGRLVLDYFFLNDSLDKKKKITSTLRKKFISWLFDQEDPKMIWSKTHNVDQHGFSSILVFLIAISYPFLKGLKYIKYVRAGYISPIIWWITKLFAVQGRWLLSAHHNS